MALNANYTWYTPAGNLTLSGTWTYRDETYYSVFTRDHNLAPSYDETDVRLLWNEPNDRYTIIAFAKNVFDQEGYEAASATHVGLGRAEPHALAARSRARTASRRSSASVTDQNRTNVGRAHTDAGRSS